MEVTRKNFKEALPLVRKSIESADFLAVDCEFSGLMSGRDVSPFDTPAEYYKCLLDGASNFLLIQYGLVAFVWDPETNRYVNEAYTFYLFPRERPGPDRVFMCQSSSLEFLVNNGFDFNKLILEGIPYLSEPSETALRKKLLERQKSYSNSKDSFIPIPTENKAQIEEICERIEKFISESEPESIVIDKCNGFIRKLVFQEASQRFKDTAYIETKVLDNKDRVLKVTRLESGSERLDKEEERKQQEIKDLDDAVGFCWVTRMISESGKLVIGHNMLLDVMHTLNHFYQPLPEDYASFKEFTHCMFPRLLDTKYMSSLPPFKDKVSSSVLSHLHCTLSEEPFSMPATDRVEGRGFSVGEGASHSAGYDAYVTGACLLGMHAHLARMRGDAAPERVRVCADAASLRPFLNKLYLFRTAHQDSPFINLVGKDPDPSRNHVLHITFPKHWNRNNIVDVFEPYGPVLVQLVDDTSAVVGLTRRELGPVAARSLAHHTLQNGGFAVQTYARYKAASGRINLKEVVAEKFLAAKSKMEDFRNRMSMISAAKKSGPKPAPAAVEGSPESGSARADAPSSAPAPTEDFISLKSNGAPAGRAGARKRTASGVFVIDVHSAPPAPPASKKEEAKQTARDSKRERRGKKHQEYEEPIIAKKPRVDGSKKETTLEKSSTDEREAPANKTVTALNKLTVEREVASERVTAFQESDNWE